MAAELFFAWQTKLAVCRAGCQDDGLGLEGFAAAGLDDLDVALKVDLNYVV